MSLIIYDPVVIQSISHNPTAFTQGLEMFDGDLLESSGGHGDSQIYRYRGTGPAVVNRVRLGGNLFGEDICVIDDQLVQLTWRDSVALRWSLPDLNLIEKVPYDREGWGMCTDGNYCYTSDGTAEIAVRDRRSLRPVRSISAHIPSGELISGLNALSYGGGVLWANKVQSCSLFEIDPQTGVVIGMVNLWDLFMNAPDNSGYGANGLIVDLSGGERTLWVTGKLHPRLIKLVLEG
ncbi:glutaminyl-peptide cyclotransferase [Nocardia vinacea]|uniref:glutaminyl-peptide cyclotransferase n=1 Tax=Nocardia vinacea TaxID=96468 RepID=UPI0005950F15|nr:glutaminyl-peptide cyclotransferase [Nocardia vinacea]